MIKSTYAVLRRRYVVAYRIVWFYVLGDVLCVDFDYRNRGEKNYRLRLTMR